MIRQAQPKHGHSLTELLVVLGMLSFLLPTATQLVHQVFHASSAVRHDVDLQRVCRQAAIQFREDAWSARSAATFKPDPTRPPLVRFQRYDGDHVEYRVQEHTLQRTVWHHGNRIHFEDFCFGPGTTVELQNDGPSHPWQVRVHRSHRSTAEDGSDSRSAACVLDVRVTTGDRVRRDASPLPEDST